MRSVALGDTFYFLIGSRAFATGIPEALGGTPDLSCIELDASAGRIDDGVTVAAHGTLTAVNVATVVATTANGYEAGKAYGVVIDAGTVDDVSVVGEVVYEFYVETAAQTASRLFYESVYPAGCVIATTTGNAAGDPDRINLSDVLDAQSTDADQVGKVFSWWDATNGQVTDVIIVSVQSSRLFNVVNAIDGSSLDNAVAAGDRIWQRDIIAVGSLSANALAQLAAGIEGTEMDLVNTPNSTAVSAIQSGLAVPGSEMALEDGAITAAKIASSAITAAKLATDAITAAKLAADAITAIQSGLATAAGVAAIRGIPAKNSAFSFTFTMHDATDGFSLEPGITVTAEVSQEGGNFAAVSGTVTEIEEGAYEFAAAAGDMNANYGVFKFTGTGCRPTTIPFVTDGGV